MGSPLDCDAAQAMVDATNVQHALAIISLHLTRRILTLFVSTRRASVSIRSASEQQKRAWNSPSHDVNCKNAALMTRQQVIDKIAND